MSENNRFLKLQDENESLFYIENLILLSKYSGKIYSPDGPEWHIHTKSSIGTEEFSYQSEYKRDEDYKKIEDILMNN